ncbi:MAG: hypothetical protein IAE82_03470 [Opitutaceae bacterium]|nr:hypothetical protein [Opitutaceae bacterium]
MTDASRHLQEIVLKFLVTLGVPDAVARRDSEGIELRVSPETLAAMRAHLAR